MILIYTGLAYNGEVATVVSWLAPTVKSDDPARCEPHRLRQPILPDVDCSRAVTSSELLTPDKACIGVVGSKSLFCGVSTNAHIDSNVHSSYINLSYIF